MKVGGEGSPTNEPTMRRAKIFSSSSTSIAVRATARSRWEPDMAERKPLSADKTEDFTSDTGIYHKVARPHGRGAKKCLVAIP